MTEAARADAGPGRLGAMAARARRLAGAVGQSLRLALSSGGGAGETGAQAGAGGDPRRRGAPPKEVAAMYLPPRSFVDHLPWVEALPSGNVLLEDGRSVGAAWELEPQGTEGRAVEWLAARRDDLEGVLQDVFDELDQAPWVVQTFTWRELDLSREAVAFRDYLGERAAEDAYASAYAELVERHYLGVARPGGLFEDALSQTSWGAARQRTVVVVYRWAGRREAGEAAGFESGLDEACGKLQRGLRGLGVRLRRISGAEFHAWMSTWFNGYTELTPDNPAEFARRYLDGEIPVGDGFSESMLYCHPRSDAVRGVWSFDRTATRVLAVEGVRKRPEVGHVTGEARRGDAINSVLDMLPEGTVYATVLVPVAQDGVDEHVDRIARAATGDSVDAARARADCEEAKEIMGRRHKLYRFGMAFYLRAPSDAELERRTGEAWTTLLQHGLRVIAPGDDVRALDNWLVHLPMGYQPDEDRRVGWRRARLAWVQHVASLWPAFGRSTGTGRPGVSFFNRGGQPLTFDPWSRFDRVANAHGLVVGPTGSGKSATLGGMLAQLMAVHRPRLFVVEAGDSFGLLADWWESLGLTVNRVALRRGSGVSLAPYVDARLLPEVSGIGGGEEEGPAADAGGGGVDDGAAQAAEDEDEEETRDIMGELETVATLMITHGRPHEAKLLRPSDRQVIRDAVVAAGRRARLEGRDTLTEDVAEAFHGFARERTEWPAEARLRLTEMGDAIRNFCGEDLRGEIFNRGGQNWPEADVTVVDLAQFARVDYETELALTVISLLNAVNNIAERDQRSSREIVVAIDEAHMVTTHPLLCPYLVRIVKMWRKLGAWLWLATQNVEDFPDEARRLLNMIEWWIVLVMPPDEVEQLSRFRVITPAQRELLLSASKASGQYTEGVVLSNNVEALFRVVPPSLLLALVQTEAEEKAKRARIQREEGLATEVEAVYRVAGDIDRERGIAT